MTLLRSDLVKSLIAALLGPADGPLEVLPRDRDPREQYICGVLGPIRPQDQENKHRDVDDDADLISEAGTDDDEESDSEIATPAFAPSLDPRLQPHSMGVTFVAEPCGPIKIGATWARYGQREDGSWERSPFFKIWHIDPQIDKANEACDGSVRLQYLSRPVAGHPLAPMPMN